MEPNDNSNFGAAPVQGSGGGMAVAALVLGIIALLLAFIPVIGMISWILAPLALIFGALGLKTEKRGLAIGGLITGGIALLICIAWVVLFGVAASQSESDLEQLQYELENMEEYQQ